MQLSCHLPVSRCFQIIWLVRQLRWACRRWGRGGNWVYRRWSLREIRLHFWDSRRGFRNRGWEVGIILLSPAFSNITLFYCVVAEKAMIKSKPQNKTKCKCMNCEQNMKADHIANKDITAHFFPFKGWPSERKPEFK